MLTWLCVQQVIHKTCNPIDNTYESVSSKSRLRNLYFMFMYWLNDIASLKLDMPLNLCIVSRYLYIIVFQFTYKSLTSEKEQEVTAKAENLQCIIFLTRLELLPQIAFSWNAMRAQSCKSWHRHKVFLPVSKIGLHLQLNRFRG